MRFSTGNMVVQKKMKLLEDMFSLEEHLFGIWKMLNIIQNFSAIYFAFLFISFSYLLVELSSRYLLLLSNKQIGGD